MYSNHEVSTAGNDNMTKIVLQHVPATKTMYGFNRITAAELRRIVACHRTNGQQSTTPLYTPARVRL